MYKRVSFFVLLAASVVYGSSLRRIRIKGGHVVSIENYGFVTSVGLVQPDGHHHHTCGGSLLAHNWVLTAAQCVGVPQLQLMHRVRVGSSFYAFGGQLVDVIRSVAHPNFARTTLDNDLGLLQLGSLAPIGTPTVTLLMPGSIVPAGLGATVLGWGYVHSYIPMLSDNLRAVDVVTVDWTICRARYAYLNALPDVTTNMICAGMQDIGGSDFCNGDEGGPLVISNIQVGIASWNYECGHPFWPGVYTSLPTYTNWIQSVVEQSFN